MTEYPAPAWRHPFLVMNPRSGGGKVVKFELQRKAEELGAEVALLEGPGQVDVDALARDAVGRGADLLGVAGGDGTQALVAGIAAEHNLPFLVISAGTRNHFALDLGLDREDPTGCLDALRDGVELHVDLGKINGRTFVNNSSFGVYAEVVQSPEYRDDKTGTVLQMLPDLIKGDKGARLHAQFDGTSVDGPQAVLVSNGPYGSHDLAGLAAAPGSTAACSVRWHSPPPAPARPSACCAGRRNAAWSSGPPSRWWSTPMCPRSRSVWTARRCCSPPRCGARWNLPPCASWFRGSARVSRPPSRRWT